MSKVTLPVILEPEYSDLAVALLRDYFAPPDGWGSDFAGAHFDKIGREWSDARYANRITASDIVAVSTLSVDIPREAAVQLLGPATEPVGELLAQIPLNLDLWNATDAQIGAHSPAWQLWSLLRPITGPGPTITSKLLARKRPRLIPVFDTIIGQQLGLEHAGGHWSALRELLNQGDGPLHYQLSALGERAGLNMDRITPLRVLDVAVWYWGNPKLTKRVQWIATDHGAAIPS